MSISPIHIRLTKNELTHDPVQALTSVCATIKEQVAQGSEDIVLELPELNLTLKESISLEKNIGSMIAENIATQQKYIHSMYSYHEESLIFKVSAR